MGSSASSIPYPLHDGARMHPKPRGGEADEPTRFDAIKDPELRFAVMRAYRAWAWEHTKESA